MSDILVGTAGWSYDDWQDVVYPAGAGGRFDRLAYMAGLCDAIEINSSFYHIPNARTVASWLSRVSGLSTFAFSAKLYKGLTHDRDPATVSPLLEEYLRAVGPLHEASRLAAVLLQFPWSFKYDAESMEWIDRLVRGLQPLPLSIEVRHTSWLNDEYLDYLKSRKIAFCNIDQPHFSTNIGPTGIVTAPFAYVRFHGRNAARWFEENEDAAERYNYLYGREELETWAVRIRDMAAQTEKVYVFMNNHAHGQGLANALEIKSLLTGQKVGAPKELMLRFPGLAEFAVPREGNTVSPPRNRGRKPAGQDDRTGYLF
jgi:uncharacterized protein YecE (DUF72 family)